MAASAKPSGIGYIPGQTPVHRLTGATKLLMVLLCSIAAMITFDTRMLLGMIVASFILFGVAKIPLRDVRFVLTLVLVFMLINNAVIYLFSPEEGVAIYGTRHELARLAGRYTITQEQLFYQLNVTLKYFTLLPLALLFMTTTEPSEFASSLNQLGVSYRVAYSVSLTLRYIPSIKRDYHEITQAQAARGIDTSSKASIAERLRNITGILFPLLFSSLSSIDTISNAMELRGFGRGKKRTWYSARRFKAPDIAVIVVSVVLVALAVTLNWLNGGRFWNPFA